MKMERQPNFYEMLLMQGAKIVKPIKMVAGSEKGGGRSWTATAKLSYLGYEISMYASFVGRKAETEAAAAANLSIKGIRMFVEGGDHVDFIRNSHQIVLFKDGVYVSPDHTEEIAEAVRKLGVTWNTSHYIGIPNSEEMEKFWALGYKRIIVWDL